MVDFFAKFDFSISKYIGNEGFDYKDRHFFKNILYNNLGCFYEGGENDGAIPETKLFFRRPVLSTADLKTSFIVNMLQWR